VLPDFGKFWDAKTWFTNELLFPKFREAFAPPKWDGVSAFLTKIELSFLAIALSCWKVAPS
jgi:hypothetical protein